MRHPTLALLLACWTATAVVADPGPAANTDAARAAATFLKMSQVLQHPRCVNCHPAAGRPLQGQDGHPHEPPVHGGRDGQGMVGMQCATCHGTGNYDAAGIPGAPHWKLAPASMAWEGKSAGEICDQLKDPSRNGGRSLAAIVRHLKEDPLVGWAWRPGVGRDPAPGTQAQLAALAEAWVAAGAHCPDL